MLARGRSYRGMEPGDELLTTTVPHVESPGLTFRHNYSFRELFSDFKAAGLHVEGFWAVHDIHKEMQRRRTLKSSLRARMFQHVICIVRKREDRKGG